MLQDNVTNNGPSSVFNPFKFICNLKQSSHLTRSPSLSVRTKRFWTVSSCSALFLFPYFKLLVSVSILLNFMFHRILRAIPERHTF